MCAVAQICTHLACEFGVWKLWLSFKYGAARHLSSRYNMNPPLFMPSHFESGANGQRTLTVLLLLAAASITPACSSSPDGGAGGDGGEVIDGGVTSGPESFVCVSTDGSLSLIHI